MDIEFFKRLSRYPFIVNHEFYDTAELKQNKTCSKSCTRKDCLELLSSASNYTEYVCSYGYNNILFTTGELKIIINGMIFDDNTLIPKGRLDVRKSWIVNRENLIIFLNKVYEIEKYIQTKLNENIEQNFSMFHDFKTSMAIILNCSQEIINKQIGKTFEEKIENSDQSIKSLYHALDLLTSQVGMMDVIVNPNSIKYGITKPVNAYKLFDKMIKLFDHMAKKRNIALIIETDGNYYPNSLCYESIEFLPLILLDNAIKYSLDGSNVFINFSKPNQNTIKIRVKNTGPIVEPQNSEKIFDKFFRDKNAIDFSRRGIGVGLWTAKKILEAHASKLNYMSENISGKTGVNIFEFELLTSQSFSVVNAQ